MPEELQRFRFYCILTDTRMLHGVSATAIPRLLPCSLREACRCAGAYWKRRA